MNQITVPDSEKPGLNKDGKKRLVVIVAYFLLLTIILFFAAGTWQWPAAWVYALLSFAALLIAGIWMVRHHPGIINERGRKAEGTKPFDKVFTRLYLPLPFLLPLVAGLDYRFDWTTIPLALQMMGAIGLVPGLILPYWAMAVNDYLATTVRIQTERGHQVCTTGPYRYVRHPMYVGSILTSVGAPLLLGSWWALLVGLWATGLIVWRTAREDQTLQAELPGYSDYAQDVRYRLLLGVW
ncbi:MAG: isoprenylcysteine carboxylmethyltransferase family protein [Anaerolineae bacterium]|nr:isoprenylcysteine carboxylmethyltransferase family protein [Anaerolineae bacterium]